jgi:hypothetical protein
MYISGSKGTIIIFPEISFFSEVVERVPSSWAFEKLPRQIKSSSVKSFIFQ